MLGAVGFLSKVFDIFRHHSTSVDLITTSEVSISLTIDDKTKLEEIIHDLSGFADVDVAENKAIISVVGEGLRRTAGIAAKFFGSLEDINVQMISLGASEVNLSIVVSEEHLIEAVKKLHNRFFSEIRHPEIFEKRRN
jgi:aspartate kinase